MNTEKFLFINFGKLNSTVSFVLTATFLILATYKLTHKMLDPFGGLIIQEQPEGVIVLVVALFLLAWALFYKLFSLKIAEKGYFISCGIFIIAAVALTFASWVLSQKIVVYFLTAS